MSRRRLEKKDESIATGIEHTDFVAVEGKPTILTSSKEHLRSQKKLWVGERHLEPYLKLSL